MEYAYQQAAPSGLNQASQPMSAVDHMNGRLGSIHDMIADAASRINVIANKIAGANPPTDKMAGAPAIVPSSAREKIEGIEYQISQLASAIARLD